jgi:hypothetical protein
VSETVIDVESEEVKTRQSYYYFETKTGKRIELPIDQTVDSTFEA